MNDLRLRALLVVSVAVVVLCARSAAAQYYPYPYLEAECPDTATGAYVTKQTSQPGFSGPGHLRSVGNISAPTYNNTSADHATYQFKTKHFAYYKLWFRVNTNNSLSDDSFYFLIDPAYYPDWVTINGISGSGWQWIQVGTFALGVGSHTLEIANREDGLNIDKIAILPQDRPAPTGTGAAAYNCPVTMYFETECRGGAYAAYQRDKVAKSGFSGTGYIESATATTTAIPRIDEATYYFETGAGAYNFFFRIHNNSNASNDSWFYSVDSITNWVTMNMTSGLGAGWRWAQGTAPVTLTHGKHSLRIRNREAGLSMDKIAFVPTSLTGPSGTGAGGTAVNCEPFQTMSDWGPGEVAEYYNTHYSFFAEMGAEMLEDHSNWHLINGQGGQRGPGSGVAFLGYHRAMMNEFRSFALEMGEGGRSWLPISTVGRSIPYGLEDAYQALMVSDMLEAYLPRTDEEAVDFGIPSYLTVGGIPSPQNWSTLVGGGDGGAYAKLEEFPTLDALGFGITFEYHRGYHNRVGGTMFSGGVSPADPIFYGWHGLIDKIVSIWLTTTKGQQWAAANQGHRFLMDGYTDTSGWNNTDWD